MTRRTEHVIIRVTPELKQQLEKMAGHDRRTLSDYVRIVLEDHISNEKGETDVKDK